MTLSEIHTPLSPSAVAHAFLAGTAPAYMAVPGLTKSLVRESAQGLIQFVRTVPTEWQARWTVHVPRNPKFDEPDDGLLIRNSPERTTDKKVMFHIRPDLPMLLEKQGVTLVEPWKSWIECCTRIHAQCLSSSFKLAQALDVECPELRCVERMHDAEASNPSVYRIGVYEPGQTGFAKEHVDRNFASLHVGSSHPGLYFRTPDGIVSGAEPEDGEVLAFPGQMAEDVSNGNVRALIHGSTPCETRMSRWFGVFFIQMIA